MKRSTACLSLLFIFSLLIFSGCGAPATGNNTGAVNANSANTGQVNGNPNVSSASGAPKNYPDMPPVIMNTKMKTIDGKSFSLKEYEGKIVFLNLWAIYCGPCRFEMPELAKVQEEYKDKGLVIIGLDIDGAETDSPAAIKSLSEKLGVTYQMAYADEDVTSALVGITKVSAIPQSFLITPDGKLAGVFKGYNPQRTPADVRQKINDLLGQAAQ